ncbi:MAG: DALR domain-containing protein, partial [Alphaproteobacteria bacterium]
EIAQSVCSHDGAPFVRYWMHNGYVTVEGEKMSKSLGNFYTVHDLLTEFPGEAIRLALLAAHYRQPLDFSKRAIAEAKGQLDRLYGALRNATEVEPDPAADPAAVRTALEDDLNTPKALSELHALAGALNRETDAAARSNAKGALLAGAALLGLLADEPEAWFKGAAPAGEDGLDEAAIEDMISRRVKAREARDFAEADRIRDELAESGIVLEDGAGGTTWKRA